MDKIKCKFCETTQDISRDGWLVESYEHGKKEVRYTPWTHVFGHMRGKKLCPGSGMTPNEMKSNDNTLPAR